MLYTISAPTKTAFLDIEEGCQVSTIINQIKTNS